MFSAMKIKHFTNLGRFFFTEAKKFSVWGGAGALFG
jgi:hypothetical protein